MNFCFDIETLSKNTNGVVLSTALVYFSLDESVTYKKLLDRALFVKFDVKQQLKFERTMSLDTGEWWKKQTEESKIKSLYPSKNDVTIYDGINMINRYVSEHGEGKNDMVWARGNLDQLLYDNLCRSAKLPLFIDYNRWMCIRTALRILKEKTDRVGYCSIPAFNKELVIKHDPVHDVCYDVMQLLYGV